MFILASQSPRRRQILEQMGLTFRVETGHVDEAAIQSQWEIDQRGQNRDPAGLVEALARAKAREVASHHPGDLVLGADTIVVWEGKILGKPHSHEEARTMLRSLSGHSHEVYTGVALQGPGHDLVFHDCAQVTFNALDSYQEAAIEAYVASGQAQDKAGAYGIQDRGATLVAGIKGDFYTVMGLPLAKTRKLLFSWGLTFDQA